MQNHKQHHARRGFSLIEVLMSIFIISIGLLGVAALIPLAHYLANRGATADRSAAAGQAALREFKTRGMDNPTRWRTTAGAVLSLGPTDTGAAAPLELAGSKKYCLDPRGVATPRNLTQFPSVGAAPMPRIALWNGVSTTGDMRMSVGHADEVFSIHDDLHFTVNDNDPAAVPVQFPDPPAPAAMQKRFANREFSWFATLVREQAGDQYTLSVAVVQSRNGATNAEMVALETEVDVTAMPGAGIGGGDVTLTASAATPLLENLAPGHWIMLSHAERARWYRVIITGELYDPSDPANGLDKRARDVTLAGRDWGTASGYGTPKAAIMASVIGVYERTIRLKTDSLW